MAMATPLTHDRLSVGRRATIEEALAQHNTSLTDDALQLFINNYGRGER
jgi:hypothetical protein